MTSVLPFIRWSYSKCIPQPINEKQIVNLENLQRIGKQFVSIMISSSLIKYNKIASNRDISSAFKKFEQQLIKRMKTSRKDVYRIFGKYCLQQLTQRMDQKCLQLEFATIFFRELNIISKSKAEPVFNFGKPQKKYSRYSDNIEDGRDAGANGMTTEISTQDNNFTLTTPPVSILSLSRDIQEYRLPSKPKLLQSDQHTTESSMIKGVTISSHKSKQIKQLSQQQFQNKSSSIVQQDFEFQLSQKDLLTKDLQHFSCEDYFIDVVGYLLNLPSPQGELTYIWQHLKWQGFETYYQPFMNQALEWTCTARILFPSNMEKQKKFLQKTQRSKNKKKAKQLACMDLLKSLYLEYPEVWMLYKHLKEQKRLVVAAVQQPKDQEEIELIRNRDRYYINQEKVEKVFKHNKTDIRKLMEGISAKAELNTLLQQLPGRVTSPKLEKKPVQGNWLVPVRIEYKTYDDIQNNRAPKVYQKSIIFQNTKIAQQEAYMEAIIEMYENHPDLFEKIQSIKLAKGIKEPEKKLPLMRTFREMYK